MKKTFTLCVILTLVFMGIQAGGIPDNKEIQISEQVQFELPILTIKSTFTKIDYNTADTWLRTPGKPVLPVTIKTYIYPLGTKIKDINITYTPHSKLNLNLPLQTASSPQPKTFKPFNQPKAPLKQVKEIYPYKPFKYTITSGRIDNKLSTILTLYLYPIQYHEEQQEIHIASDANIKITIRSNNNPILLPNELELLIITVDSFNQSIQPLVNHKNNQGVNTTVVTIETIESTYPGNDSAERVKQCIKHYLETTGIKYVLLIGGLRSQTQKWHVPVRYAHVDDNSNFETSFLSDLYFADIYDGEGNFSEWDPNHNGRYAEWNDDTQEIIDLTPEISVGRLPCRNKAEVKLMVNKIITYETSTSGEPWFNRMVTVGGDSAPGYEFYEGEEENKQALQYMQNFEGITLWTSDNTFTGPEDVITAVSEGCGFLFFDGHGNPSTWSTHPPDDKKTWITGLELKHMPKLTNGNKLPVIVVGACHNGQFNVSLSNILHVWLRLISKYIAQEGLIKGIVNGTIKYWKSRFYYMEWVPESWAWRLIRKIGGGGIAIMAYTGLDWFAEGDYNGDGIPDCIQFFSGFANTHFFKNYGVNNLTILGDAHRQTLIDYIQAFPPMDERLDAKTVEEFALIGDPSLRIGGFS